MRQIVLFFCLIRCLTIKAETTPATSNFGGDDISNNPYQIACLAQHRLMSETSGNGNTQFFFISNIGASDTRNWNVNEKDILILIFSKT